MGQQKKKTKNKKQKQTIFLSPAEVWAGVPLMGSMFLFSWMLIQSSDTYDLWDNSSDTL